MFQVNGNPLIADETEILQVLRSQCAMNGNDLFRVIKPTGADNIMVTCPFHKEGTERKPSFGISRLDGTCHCFTCGWIGSLDEMISNVMGYDDQGDYGRKWLARNFLVVTIESRKLLVLPMSRQDPVKINATPGFTEQELEKYRYYHPYMYQRGLTNEVIDKFDVGYDGGFELVKPDGSRSNVPCITFPVYALDGTPAFIARRAVKTKLFHYPRDVEKPVYAANIIAKGTYAEVIIAESILNALTCWKHGRPAVALLGTGTEAQYKILQSLPVKKYIIGTDPDEAGKKAGDKLYKNLKTSKIITWFDIPKGKDLNDLDDQVKTLSEYF